MSEGHIAIPRHLHNVPLCLDFQQPLENSHQISHWNRGGVSEIENPQLSGTTLLATTPSALVGGVQSPQTALDNVIDVGEVPSDSAVVGALEDRNGFALENVSGEEEVGHVRSSPGTVDREEAQTGEREAIDVVVSVSNLFAGFLSSSVEASRLVGAVFLGERDFGVQSVDGARGGPDDGRLGVSRFTDLEEIDEASDVAVNVGAGVFHGVPDAGLSGQMHNVGERDHLEELLEERRVVDVSFHHEHPAPLQEGLPRSLERRIVVIVEVVQPQNAVPASFQGRRDMGAHEPGGSGDENRDAAAGADMGGGSDTLLPSGASPGVGAKGAARWIGKGGGRSVEEDEDEADEDQRPEGQLCHR